MGRSVFRSLLLGSWLVLAAAGCAVSPQPEPPSIAAETISILLDSDTLVRVVGEAGTVSPAGATVTIRNLDSTMAPSLPVEVASDAEGGFVAVVPGMPAEVFRLQALSGDVRSRPLDLMGGAPGPARPFRRPLDDCFLIGGESAVDLGVVAVGDVQSARVDMENRCPMEVVVEGVFARMGSPGVFAMAGAPPVRIASGTTRFFIVTFAPLEPGPVEAIVNVMVGPPMPHPRPITVVGLGITE